MNYDNGYRYYVLEYVLDRWIPISMHDTYHGALANVTAEHQVIAQLDKGVTITYQAKCEKIPTSKQVRQAVFFSELQKNFNEILGNK